MKLNIKTNNRGFSLLELLIYISLLAGFLLVITNLFFTVSVNSAKEEARAEVRQNLRFALERIADEVRAASAVTLPVSGSSGNVLDIMVGGAATEFGVSSGVLQKTRNAVTENITTGKVTVGTDNPVFIRLDNAGVKPAIQISLTISYNDNGRPNYKFSETVQTTVSLRQ